MRWPRGLLLALVGLSAVGCFGGGNAPSATSRAETSDARFRLVFEVPRTEWHAADSITGLATLSNLGSGGIDIGASGGGPMAFSIDQVGGTLRMDAGFTLDCVGRRIEAGGSIASPIKKTGGWGGDDPNAEFYKSFFADPLLHLPPGDWTIAAVADFLEGSDCSGAKHELRAEVRIHVAA